MVLGGVAALVYSVGRDRKAVGSPTDVAFATAGTPGVRVGLLDHEGSPVDFAPPDNIRPAQVRAGPQRGRSRNTDVAATIVDLAVRGYLRIEEVGEKKRTPTTVSCAFASRTPSCFPYENTLLLGSLFMGQNDVMLSQFEDTFAAKLEAVKNMVYTDGVERGWFSERPDKIVRRWQAPSASYSRSSVPACSLRRSPGRRSHSCRSRS